jgi:tetratricopeptide (TPR) repeat protein
VFILVELGEFDDAFRIARETAALAEARQVFYPLAHFATPWTALQRGDPGSAIPALERGLGLCNERHHLAMAPAYAAALGRAYALVGRVNEGIATLHEALTVADTHNRANRSLFLTFLSETYLQARQAEEAHRAAETAVTGAQQRAERGEEAWALRALAEAIARGDRPDPDAADSYYHQAMTLADELGMRPLLARCHAGLAALCQQVGKMPDAEEHRRTSMALYQAMGMTYWQDQLDQDVASM